MKYARVHNNVVVEILTPVDGFSIEDCFHPDILDKTITVGSDVEQGWFVNSDGSVTATALTEEQIAANKAALEAQIAADKQKVEEAIAAAQTAPTGPTGV